LSVSLLAIFQKFTGIGIYEPSWMAPDHRRVTAMFSSPNAVGLFLGPIATVYAGWLMAELKNKAAALLKLFVITLALLAIWFTESTGTLLGLTAAFIFLGFFGWSKKWTTAIVLGALIACLAVPLTRHRVIETILLRDTSGQNRIFLWSTALGHLTQNPKSFLLGTGILGFAELQNNVRDPLKIEPLLYPHNIILNLWVETGILGVLAITWLIAAFYKRGFSTQRNWLTLGIMAAMVTVIIHGLIDVPYFKNDLSMLFWIIISLL
jgi:O-antigen ligase